MSASGVISFSTNSNERMRVTSNGNVGIGTTGPSEKLHVVGNLRVQGTTDCTLGNGAGATNCSSDARLKDNVTPIENALDKISQITGVEFDWNEKSLAPGKHSIGVIAQDVQKVFPTAVVENKSGYLAVDYAVLVSPLIQAAKELKNRCEMSDAIHGREIASLKEEHASLSKKHVKLEVENAQLKAELAGTRDAMNREIQFLKSYLCSKDPAAPVCK